LETLVKILTVFSWPIVVVAACLIFRGPIGSLLQRIEKVKTSNLDLQARPQPPDSPAPVVALAQPGERSPDNLAIDGKENSSPESLDVFSRFEKAFEARDLRAMSKLRVELKESGKNDGEKAENDAFCLAFSSVAGDSEAIEELKKRCNDESPYAVSARLWLAWTLSVMDQPSLAKDAYRSALEIVKTDKERAQANIGLAHEMDKSGQWEDAIRILVDALESISDATERAGLLNAVAETAKRHEQNFLAVIALEESVTLNPEDTSSLFELGYRSGEAGLSRLSAAAYKQLLAIAPKNENGLNNLGVELKQLNLPALSVQRYEQASELGDTLADANLANILIDAGFLSTARDRLTIAAAIKGAHENVHSALARIDTKQKSEEETLQKVLEQARGSADQLIKFSQSLFSDHAAHKIEGFWSQPGEAPFQLEGVDGNIAGSCTVDKHQWKIAGHTDFAGGGHIDITQTDGSAHPRLKGYMCLESDGSVLRFALHDDKGELMFWRFDRIQPTTA
jgi:tetratricopeptide (TPR) repeat protein